MKIKIDIHQIRAAILDAIDLLLLPAGIGMIGIGLWMYRPWVSLMVTGVVILILALTMELRSK